MTTASAPKTFRLLDLPPELRNNIYELVSTLRQRDAPHNIEVLALKQYYPDRAITQLNRQTREESLGLHHAAAAEFFDYHTIYVRMGTEATDAAWCKYLTDYSQDIPFCSVRQIQLRVEGCFRPPGTSLEDALLFEARMRQGEVIEWDVTISGVQSHSPQLREGVMSRRTGFASMRGRGSWPHFEDCPRCRRPSWAACA